MHPFRIVARVRLGLLLSSLCLLCPQVRAQSDLSFAPYTVFVSQAEAHARCGPSGDYYRTDPLRHGQELEVYAETDDGWLGIRPPDDSFCWIPAETVEMDPGNETGVIKEDRTVAWIGTHLGRARKYRWQVQLAEGEPVTIIGRSEREGPDGPQLWLRIVPPSGEYRWVHRDQVVRTSEELIASVQKSNEEVFPGHAGPTYVDRGSNQVARAAADAPGQPRSARRNSPVPQTVADAGRSILTQPPSSAPIGSGVSERATGEIANHQPADRSAWQASETHRSSQTAVATDPEPQTVTAAMKKGGLLASIEFLGRPKLLEIGNAPSAPAAIEAPADANWVAGAVRPAPVSPNPVPVTTPATEQVASQQTVFPAQGASLGTPPGAVRQASATLPAAPSPVSHTTFPTIASATTPTNVVSAERIAQIENEVRGADVERLSLIFSRLMAARASAAEVDPIARAAHTLASSSLDTVVAGRARLLAERAEQYRRLASRRDGRAVIQSTGAPTLPANQTLLGNASQVQDTSMQGFLVQVYSARTNSPPFALTDNTGRTVAYVTPIPGVNLRPHLNSRVNVSGSPGYLTGLNTPHILASQAVRTPE